MGLQNYDVLTTDVEVKGKYTSDTFNWEIDDTRTVGPSDGSGKLYFTDIDRWNIWVLYN